MLGQLLLAFPVSVVLMDIVACSILQYPRNVKSVAVEPDGALDVSDDGSLSSNWRAYTVKGKTWGRSRLTITYDDSSVETIQYFVIKPEAQAVADMGISSLQSNGMKIQKIHSIAAHLS